MDDAGDGGSDGIQRRTLYGRRRGKKLRAGQESQLDTLLPKLRVALPEPPRVAADGSVLESPRKLDLAALFGGRAPARLHLEIGFGAGEHLVWQAERNPDAGFIGVEPYLNGMARCLAAIDRAGLGNVRLYDDDARHVLAALPPRSLERVYILFPDPWPKLRHHKRRIVSRNTLDILANLLLSGGELRTATDDPSYLPWMVEHACLHPAFEWLAERPADWRTRREDWPPTRYEIKRRAGCEPTFLRLRRRS